MGQTPTPDSGREDSSSAAAHLGLRAATGEDERHPVGRLAKGRGQLKHHFWHCLPHALQERKLEFQCPQETASLSKSYLLEDGACQWCH